MSINTFTNDGYNNMSGEPFKTTGINIGVPVDTFKTTTEDFIHPLAPNPNSGKSCEQAHYMSMGELQPIEIMQSIMSPIQFQGFCRGNVIKYICRAGTKDAIPKEIDKVIQYAKWLKMSLEGKKINPRE